MRNSGKLTVSRVLAVIALGGCSGQIGSVSPGGSSDRPGGPGGAGTGMVDPSNTVMAQTCTPSIPAAPMRRLSNAEYQATMKDLFGSLNLPAPTILHDPASHGFENQAKLLNPSPLLVEQYGTAAIDVGLKLSTTLTSPILPCAPKTAAEEKTCGAQFVETFGAKVLRRPLTAVEKTDYETYFESERALSNFAGAVQLTTEVLLQSPQFLYRPELGDPAAVEMDRIKLTQYEIATRLSYLLSGSAPDATLLGKAQQNTLDMDAVRETEARRLLADPRASAMFVEFHRQWLDFDKLSHEPKDPKTFPAYTPELTAAIREESDRFVALVMGSTGDGTLKSFLTSTKTEVNAPLAKLYGVTGPATGWAAVDLKATERAGFLTRSNFLASRAHQLAGSPPLRANYVLQRLLCMTVPPPPANADLSEPASKGTGAKTNRQLFEERTAPATCNACHSSFTPLGYALESYDAIGQYRTTDSGLPVDATGHFVMGDMDWQLNGAIDMSAKLADSPVAQGCVASNWFEYALGRDIETADQCRMAKLSVALAEAGGDIREMLVALVKTPEFVYRDPIVR
jgi:Protein of unknown function (DUF1592)/Protein of unknown function (DUF1588)/Protein of unknown function (DUF1595)/Protein of unknown function (DUF1585)/Protein of unknown function (DUF1587)